MVRNSFRVVLCALVGLIAGRMLGPLFVPNPTGMLAFALTTVVAVSIGGGHYYTDFREGTDSK